MTGIKHLYKITILFIFISLAAVSGCMPSGDINRGSADYTTEAKSGSITVHFIDVGQGDATLIQCGDEAMLIDAGGNEYGDDVLDYIKYLGISRLEYLVGTHPDADHIGGLDTVASSIECGTVLMPDISNDTKSYRDVMETLSDRGYEITTPVPGDVYMLSDATVTVVAPVGDYYEETNDYSIGLTVLFGNVGFLFLGDAEEDAEDDIIESGADISADVYKVSHHGSSDACSMKLLYAVSPDYAVISAGLGNDYGHPHEKVLDMLREMGTEVYRTDEQGTIVVTSDGKSISWNMSPSETWRSGWSYR